MDTVRDTLISASTRGPNACDLTPFGVSDVHACMSATWATVGCATASQTLALAINPCPDPQAERRPAWDDLDW